MENNNGSQASNATADIIALVDEKITNDTDFQGTLSNLSQEDADQKIAEKRNELIKQEYLTLAEKAKKDAELAINYKARAEKAEKGGKTTSQAETVSIADLHALRNVHDEDIGEVQEYAKFKGISIKDALSSNVVKTLLADKEEQRKVAEATNTRTTRSTVKMPDDSELLENASKGELPNDPTKLAEARQKQRLSTLKK